MADPYAAVAPYLPLMDRINPLLLSSVTRRLVGVLRRDGARSVLDVACGTGTLLARLRRAGFEVVGADRSPTMLARVPRNAPGVEVHEVDARDLPFENQFDAATIQVALHEMDPAVAASVWASMKRAVRPGGLVVAVDYGPGSGLVGRIAARRVRRDERQTVEFDPDHWTNYQAWMEAGGTRAWLEALGDEVAVEERALGGAFRVCGVRV